MSEQHYKITQIVIVSLSIVTSVLAVSHIVSAKEELRFNPKITIDRIPMDFSVNYDKLCKAIAVAETAGCTDGTAIKRKNCHGLMAWKKVDGKTVRYPQYFKSHAESQAACVSLWKRRYVRYPDINLAELWTGKDNSVSWLQTVTKKYQSL